MGKIYWLGRKDSRASLRRRCTAQRRKQCFRRRSLRIEMLARCWASESFRLSKLKKFLTGWGGRIRTFDDGFRVHCLTTWLLPNTTVFYHSTSTISKRLWCSYPWTESPEPNLLTRFLTSQNCIHSHLQIQCLDH